MSMRMQVESHLVRPVKNGPSGSRIETSENRRGTRGLTAVSLTLTLIVLLSVTSTNANTRKTILLDAQGTYSSPAHPPSTGRDGLRSPEAFDILHYDVNVTFSLDAHILNGTANITIKFAGPTDRLMFDLALRPYSVTLSNGTAPTYDYGRPLLTVHSDGLFPQGSTVNLVVRYGGVVDEGALFKSDYIGREGSWIQRGEYLIPEPHRADSSALFDRFTADLNVTVPSGRIVVSNGELVDARTPSGGNWTYYWRTSDPAVALSVAEGAFGKTTTRHGGVDIELYLFPRHDQLSAKYLDEAMRILDVYDSLFSAYPYPKLAIVEIPSVFPYGAACLQSFVVVQTQILDNFGPSEGPLPHEIAHNWWGEMVIGLGDEASWLQEGFASYASDLYGEYQYGNLSRLTNQKRMYYQTDFGSSESPVATGFSVYYKGPWVLHMLRYVLGNLSFFQALNRFATAFAFSGGVTISDFRNVSEAVYNQDLHWFFQEWLYETRHLSYEVTSARCLEQRNGTCLTEVEVHRTGDAVMPVDVGFTTIDGHKVVLEKRINLTLTNWTVSRFSDARTANVTLDPRGWLLAPSAALNVTLVPFQRPIFEEPLFWISVVAVLVLVVAVLVTVRKRRRGRGPQGG